MSRTESVCGGRGSPADLEVSVRASLGRGRYEDTLTTVTGAVVQIQLVNPHSMLILEVKDEVESRCCGATSSAPPPS